MMISNTDFLRNVTHCLGLGATVNTVMNIPSFVKSCEVLDRLCRQLVKNNSSLLVLVISLVGRGNMDVRYLTMESYPVIQFSCTLHVTQSIYFSKTFFVCMNFCKG